MTSKERVVTALQNREPDRIPIFEWIIDKRVTEAITGSTDYFGIIEHLDLDAVVLRPDYKKEPFQNGTYKDEWGCVRKETGEGVHSIIQPPIVDINEISKFKFPDPNTGYRLKNLKKAVERFASERAVIINLRDVFSDIRDLLGYENVLVNLLLEQKKVGMLLDRCVEYNIEIAKYAKEKFHINVLVTTDDYASNSGLLFSPELFDKFFLPRFKKIVRAYKDLGYYCIKHTDGYIMPILDELIEAGVDCIDPIDPVAGMDIEYIKKMYGKKVCLKGNVDNVGTLVSGSLEDVRKEVRRKIDQAGYNGGYILSSSNTIHSGVKPDNFVEMVKESRRYGIYPLKRK